MTPEQFRAYLTIKGLADNTIRTYNSFYTRWHGHPSRHPQFSPECVREWSLTIPQTRSSLHQARTVVARACEAQGITDDLPQAIRIAKSTKPKQSRALTLPQVRRLHTVAADAGLPGLALLVGLYTGGRRSEIAGLDWTNVEWGDPDDEIPPEITLTRPKNSDTLTLPLHPTLRRHLGHWHVPGQRWVFPGRWGGHVSPSTVWRWIIRLADEADVGDMYPHRLRHTAGSMVVETMGIPAGMRFLGHSDPQTTARYATATDSRMRDAVRELDVFGDAA